MRTLTSHTILGRLLFLFAACSLFTCDPEFEKADSSSSIGANAVDQRKSLCPPGDLPADRDLSGSYGITLDSIKWVNAPREERGNVVFDALEKSIEASLDRLEINHDGGAVTATLHLNGSHALKGSLYLANTEKAEVQICLFGTAEQPIEKATTETKIFARGQFAADDSKAFKLSLELGITAELEDKSATHKSTILLNLDGKRQEKAESGVVVEFPLPETGKLARSLFIDAEIEYRNDNNTIWLSVDNLHDESRPAKLTLKGNKLTLESFDEETTLSADDCRVAEQLLSDSRQGYFHCQTSEGPVSGHYTVND